MNKLCKFYNDFKKKVLVFFLELRSSKVENFFLIVKYLF